MQQGIFLFNSTHLLIHGHHLYYYDNNNIVLNGVKHKMSGTRTCMDCGKQVRSESQENEVICEDCVRLLKRRFWTSIKIEKAHDAAATLNNRRKYFPHVCIT